MYISHSKLVTSNNSIVLPGSEGTSFQFASSPVLFLFEEWLWVQLPLLGVSMMSLAPPTMGLVQYMSPHRPQVNLPLLRSLLHLRHTVVALFFRPMHVRVMLISICWCVHQYIEWRSGEGGVYMCENSTLYPITHPIYCWEIITGTLSPCGSYATDYVSVQV